MKCLRLHMVSAQAEDLSLPWQAASDTGWGIQIIGFCLQS